ncbi:hypothetical protein D3C77_139210 [compost metagenome]
MARNFWAPKPRPNTHTIRRNDDYVDLRIHILGGAITVDKVIDHVKEAASVWCECSKCKCGINVIATEINEIPNPAFKIPGVDPNDVIKSISPFDTNEVWIDELFYLGGSHQRQDAIEVFYLNGEEFSDSRTNSLALTRIIEDRPSEQPYSIIILGQGSNGLLLAHEIGHLLFVEVVEVMPSPNPNVKTYQVEMKDPETNELHNKDADNLMFVPVTSGKITTAQCNATINSKLRKSGIDFQDVINGPLNITITINSLLVDWKYEEDLELRLNIKVMAGVGKFGAGFKQNTMCSKLWIRGNVGFSAENIDYDYKFKVDHGDTVIIHIDGSEDSDWPDDDNYVPAIIDHIVEGADLWKSAHPENPNIRSSRAKNDTVGYTVHYSVRVDDGQVFPLADTDSCKVG